MAYERGDLGGSIDALRALLKRYADGKERAPVAQMKAALGKSCAEAGLYAEAVTALTGAIEEDPKNLELYLDRAGAYFELGEFDQAVNDYIASGKRPREISLTIGEFRDFSNGLVAGVLNGGEEGLREFIPSALATINGLGHALWAAAADPQKASLEFADACQDCLDYLTENGLREAVPKLVPELGPLLDLDQGLSHGEVGEALGFVIGKYGIDIFLCTESIKGIQAARRLCRANRLATLETMAASAEGEQAVLRQAAKRHAYREQVVQRSNFRIQPGKQGKHVSGHPHYRPTRSQLIHPDPQALVDGFAGKGTRANPMSPGEAGFKERIDFGEVIGLYRKGGLELPTTRGIIHYSKDGVHIVPSAPTNLPGK